MINEEFFKNIKNGLSLEININSKPFSIMDDKFKIVYTNNKFISIFGKNRIDQLFDFIYNKSKDGSNIPLSDFPVETLTEEDYVFYYYNDNDKEFVYNVQTLFCADKGKTKYYICCLHEMSSIREQLVDRSIQALLKASQLKDNDTGNHVSRLDEYSKVMAEYIYKNEKEKFTEVDTEFINEISRVSSMHDVGKIGVPDQILTKPGKLDDDEFAIMKEHTINGAFILSELAGKMARDIALFHHEKWDGNGYPYGLSNSQIPLSARILAIGDVYDALRMKRVYKPPFPHEKAKKIILESSGTHFDPELIRVFENIHLHFERIFDKLDDTEILEEL